MKATLVACAWLATLSETASSGSKVNAVLVGLRSVDSDIQTLTHTVEGAATVADRDAEEAGVNCYESRGS